MVGVTSSNLQDHCESIITGIVINQQQIAYR